MSINNKMTARSIVSIGQTLRAIRNGYNYTPAATSNKEIRILASRLEGVLANSTLDEVATYYLYEAVKFLKERPTTRNNALLRLDEALELLRQFYQLIK